MFSKSILAFAFMAIAHLATASTPPACLLGAINTADDPSAVSTICKDDSMSGTIAKYCGNGAQQAMVSYASVCKNAGVTVSTEINSTATASSSTGRATATGKSNANSSASATGAAASATGTGMVTSVSGTASSATGTGSVAQSTGAAGRLEAGFVAAILGGILAAAL